MTCTIEEGREQEVKTALILVGFLNISDNILKSLMHLFCKCEVYIALATSKIILIHYKKMINEYHNNTRQRRSGESLTTS